MGEHGKKLRALWLCSWYPEKMQPQNGDFVQRQAYATALYSEVTTIHIAPCSPSKLDGANIRFEMPNNNDHLTENILYYKKRKNTITHRILSTIQYFYQYRKWIANYMKSGKNVDIVHVHIAWRDGLIALWIKKKYNIPYVLTEHWTAYLNDGDAGFNDFNFLQRSLIRKVLINASIVLPVSVQLGEQLKTLFGINYKPIGNVVDTSLFFPGPKKDQYNCFTFIHISDGSSKKNVESLLIAFTAFNKKVPVSQLLIVGIDLEKEIVAQFNNKNGIQFIPNIPYKEVAQILKKSHVTIVNSLYETFSCVIIESLSCGIPVISTNVGVAPEIINPTNGVIVEKNNQSLLEGMVEVYEKYDKYIQNQDPVYIQNKFNYKNIGADINDIYSDILKMQ